MHSARGFLATIVFLLLSLYLLYTASRLYHQPPREEANSIGLAKGEGEGAVETAKKSQWTPASTPTGPTPQPTLGASPSSPDLGLAEAAEHAGTGTAAASAPSTPSGVGPQTPSISAAEGLVEPNDVVLILKTGSNNVWRRLPLHFLTTFANNRIPNYAIYSDAHERLAPGIATIDAIANVSQLLGQHDPAAHRIYTSQLAHIRPNTYREQAGLAGDTTPDQAADGNPEGWVLDRYKFLPMLQHAYTAWPDRKWYFYIEDDTYPFWWNIRQFLARHDHTAPAYYGAMSGPSNATFAQGGSGIAFTHALMQKMFNNNNNTSDSSNQATLDKYANLTAAECCGDIILGAILRDYGAEVNGGEFGPSLLFRPEPPWKTRFDVSVWCEPVMTFHHLHQQDLALFSELEEELRVGGPGEPGREKVLFRDVFMKFVYPYLIEEIREGKGEQVKDWDNHADLWLLRDGLPVPTELLSSSEGVVGVDVAAAVRSSEGCKEACRKVEKCFSWKHTGATCSLDSGVKFGAAQQAPMQGDQAKAVVTSGWMLDRLNATLLANECWGFRD
ncbi:uncharacterized protein B0T15DRAFT_537846 [Chaetomium strumarium]|uniref:Glycosyltransferase family 31 protein n=1 Tax=Chaetomium strumarium TaxID=1170767 RepID=A0AAJ0M0V6_9PEZI|nr:hypothetical protein B0T15DRAFT_537846 [Chaetomium strumarium]